MMLCCLCTERVLDATRVMACRCVAFVQRGCSTKCVLALSWYTGVLLRQLMMTRCWYRGVFYQARVMMRHPVVVGFRWN